MSQGITIFMRLIGSQQVASNAAAAERSIDRVGLAASRLAPAARAGLLGVATGLAVGASAGVKYNASIEQLQVSFETLIGSQKKAAGYMEFLKDKGARTPFKMKDLAETSQILLGFNYNLGETKHLLDKLGNASSALGTGPAGLNSMALIFGQIRAKGRLQGDEIQQLAENKFGGAGDIVRNAMGLSKKDFQKALEAGKIDADTAIDALTEYMDRKYAGAMDKQSQTLSGQWSTFQDNLQQKIGGLTAPAAGPLTKFLADVNGLLDPKSKHDSKLEKDVRRLGDALEKAGNDAKPFYDYVLKPAVDGLWDVLDAAASKTGKHLPGILDGYAKMFGAMGESTKAYGDEFDRLFDKFEKWNILMGDHNAPRLTQLDDHTTTSIPAPMMVPGRVAPKRSGARKPKSADNPLGLPTLAPLKRGLGDIRVTVEPQPLVVDGRQLAEADARARADAKARR